MARAIYLGACTVAIGLVVLSPKPASGELLFYTGNDVYQWCTTVGAEAPCGAYVTAIADAINNRNTIDGWRACLPRGVTRGQVEDVAVQFLQRNVARRHEGAANLIAEALSGAFPCR